MPKRPFVYGKSNAKSLLAKLILLQAFIDRKKKTADHRFERGLYKATRHKSELNSIRKTNKALQILFNLLNSGKL